jgi:hypothetical protein
MHLDPMVSNMIIGGISGTVSNMAVFPVELVKTKMQNAASDEEKQRYRDVASTVTSITTEKGFPGLWEGSTAVLLGSAPESAIQLASHSWLIATFALAAGGVGDSGLTVAQQLLSGALAGAATLIATNPMEVLRLQISENGGSIAELSQKLGLAGLFKGSSATLLRDIPFAALYYTLYWKLKTVVGPLLGPHASDCVVQFCAGLSAGAIASLSTTPCDFIKTRIQSRIGHLPPAASSLCFSAPGEEASLTPPCGEGDLVAAQRRQREQPPKNRPLYPECPRLVAAFATEQDLGIDSRASLYSEVVSIVSAEGAGVLMRGAGLRVAKIAPRMAISLAIYESLQHLNL